jgi:GAF domain-containing protein
MAKEISPTGNKVKTKSSARKPVQKTGVSKIRILEKQLAQREAELAVINSIQTALASNLDFQGIIDIVGDKLNEIFKDGNVGIGLIDKARNVVSIPYVIENGKRLEYFEVSMDQPSVMQHIIKRRKPVLINSKFQQRFGRNDTIMFPGRDQRNLKSWLSVPFFKGNEVIGGMSLRSWDRENAFTESDVRLLQTIANSVSVALDNARLFDKTQRLLKETEQRATELQIINNIGQTLSEGLDLNTTLERVGERLREALKIENIGIAAFDPKNDLVIAQYMVRNGKQITGDQLTASKFKFGIRLASRWAGRSWVVNTNLEKGWRKFGQISEEPRIPKSWVMLPLLAGGQVIGGISIADFERENAFADLSVGMLETIASNMGITIQNVRLFEETQRLLEQTEQRATELQIINNIGQTLTEVGDLDSMIQRVGERIQEALNVKDIVISLFDEKTGRVQSPYMVRNGEPVEITEENIDLRRFKLGIRASARAGGRSWVVNKVAEKTWRKWWISMIDN